MDEEQYLALMQAAYGNWSPDQPYHWTNQIPEQMYDAVAPRSDHQANIMVNRAMGGMEGWEGFSNDVLNNIDPNVRPFLAEALDQGKGDYASALAYVNAQDYGDRIGRTYWDQLAASGPAEIRRALADPNLSGEERDKIAVDYTLSALENGLAQGMPSVNRNMGYQQQLMESVGGRPFDGAAGLPQFEGPGFGGGPEDPEAARVGTGPGGALRGEEVRNILLQQQYQDAAMRAPMESSRNLMHATLVGDAMRSRGRRDLSPGTRTRANTAVERRNRRRPTFTRDLLNRAQRGRIRQTGSRRRQDRGGGGSPWLAPARAVAGL